mgnify:CR=1 FL=1
MKIEKTEKNMDKKLIKYVDLILKDIIKNGISKEHRKSELEINCSECKFRLLEAYLKWYKDLIKFSNNIK